MVSDYDRMKLDDQFYLKLKYVLKSTYDCYSLYIPQT